MWNDACYVDMLQAPLFLREIAHQRKNSISIFREFFASIDKNLHFGRKTLGIRLKKILSKSDSQVPKKICFISFNESHLKVMKNAFYFIYLQTEKIWAIVLHNQYMFAKNYHLHWIADRGNILSKYILYIFFNFGRGFYGSFPILFPKARISFVKKFLK